MRFSLYTPAYLLFASLAAFPVVSATSFSPLDITTIAAPDGSIKAGFMAFGATLTKLLVKNKHGKLVDVVPGFDNTSHWVTDGNHIISISCCSLRPPCLPPHYNGCIGRYANRIKNGTFSIPITKYPQPDGPNVYHTPLNDHNAAGEDTLHSGVGWDLRNWTVVDLSATSVKYLRIDDEEDGFPGTVNVTVTYSVENRGVLSMSIHATASEKTPIMVTHHDYFNLCLQDGCDDVLGHKLQIFASRRIEVDGDAIPTGNLLDVSGTPYDFRAGRALGAAFEEDLDFPGYDNALIYDKSKTGEKKSGVSNVVRTTLSSDVSGIQLDIRSDQPAVQVYLASLNLPRKEAHGGPEKKYGERSTVAIEQEGWIDAINTPEWNENQIYSPERPFNWNTVYTFSVVR